MIAQAHILWQRIHSRVLYGPMPRAAGRSAARVAPPSDPVQDWAHQLEASGRFTVLDVTRVGDAVRMHVVDARGADEHVLTYHVDSVGTLYVDPTDFTADTLAATETFRSTASVA